MYVQVKGQKVKNICLCLCVCIAFLRPSQQFFSHVGTEQPLVLLGSTCIKKSAAGLKCGGGQLGLKSHCYLRESIPQLDRSWDEAMSVTG